MGGVYSTQTEMGNTACSKDLQGSDNLEYLGTDGTVVVKFILKKQDVRVSTELKWLQTG